MINSGSVAEDYELVKAAVRGDEDAFRELYDRHRRLVYSICWRFTRNRDDALDIVQEVFVKLHRAMDTFDGRSKFTTWLGRITTNAAIDWTRRQKGEHYEYKDELAGPEQEEGAPDFLPRSETPLDATQRAEVLDKIQEAVDTLSEKHRSVFLLNTVEGLSYQEIADVEEIPIGTVMSRLHYARRYLREALAPYLERGEAVGSGAEGARDGEGGGTGE